MHFQQDYFLKKGKKSYYISEFILFDTISHQLNSAKLIFFVSSTFYIMDSKVSKNSSRYSWVNSKKSLIKFQTL